MPPSDVPTEPPLNTVAELNAVADYLNGYRKHLLADRDAVSRLRAVAAQIVKCEAKIERLLRINRRLLRINSKLVDDFNALIIHVAQLEVEREQILCHLKRERAIAEAVRERVLAEFAVPVEFRPTGWCEKEPALRQRSADETRDAIRALDLRRF
jgi:hypothetical protein